MLLAKLNYAPITVFILGQGLKLRDYAFNSITIKLPAFILRLSRHKNIKMQF